ncbi:MAG: aspartate kinase [Chloroflexi bacterium]|nr:aspartate kinase [Chloroflexota bacterium]
MSTLIMKFGGTSVGMTMGLTQLLSIVLYERERWERLMLVVSALDGVTDQLIEAAHLALLNNRRGYRRIVATLRTRHLALIEYLPLGITERNALQADIDRLLFDMLDVCQNMPDNLGDSARPEAIDRVISTGERLAARIVAALLRQNNLRGVAIDATDVIITDNVFGNATPNLPMTRDRIAANLLPLLNRGIIPVITGFIGATPNGKTTTLGRGGSDYTASIVGVCSDAQEVWVWTDVDGMMTADPREVDDARVIPTLSYDEVAEMAYFGARILHSRMIIPLRERRIPLRVRNVFKPQQSGTLVHIGTTPMGFKSVTMIQGLGLTAQHSGALTTITALVDEKLSSITGSHTDVMISAQSASDSFVCFVIPTNAGPDALHSLQSTLAAPLAKVGEATPWTMRPVSIVTVVGSHLGEDHNLTAQLLSALESVRILALAQGPSHNNISLVVEPEDTDAAIDGIHELILSSG